MSCLTRTSSSGAGSTSGRKRHTSKRLKNNRNSFVIDRVLFSHDGQPLRNVPTTTNDSAISLVAEAPTASHARVRTNDSAIPPFINLKRVLKPTDPTAPLPQPEPHWPQQPPTPVESAHQHRREHGTRPSAMTIARALNIPPPPMPPPPPPSNVPAMPAIPQHVLDAHMQQQARAAGSGRQSPVVGSVDAASQPFGSRPARPTGMVFLPPYLGDEQQHSTMSLVGQMHQHQQSGLANVQRSQRDTTFCHSRYAPPPQPFVLPSVESSLSQSLGKHQQSTGRPLSILPAGYRRDYASQAYAYGSAGRHRPLEVLNASGGPDQPVVSRRPSAYQQRPAQPVQRHDYHQLESPVDPPSSYDSTNDPIVGFRRSYGGRNIAPTNLRPARHLPRPNSQVISSSVPQHHHHYHQHSSRSHMPQDYVTHQQHEYAGSLLRMPSLNSIRNTPHLMSADLHGGYSRSRVSSNASSHRHSSYMGAPRTSLLARELASQSVLPPYTGPGLSYWPLDLGLPLTSVQVSANMHRYSRTKADDLADAYGLAALLETWTDLHTRLAHIVEDHVGRVGARVSTCHAMQAALTHIAAPLAHRNVAATHSTFVATHVPDLAGDFTGMPLPECGGAPSIVTTHSVFVALDAAAPTALVKYIAPLADHGAQAVATALSLSGGPTEDLDNWVSEYLLFWIRLKRERPGVAAFVFAPFSVLKEPAAAAMVEVVGGGAAASPNKAGAAGNNGENVVVQGTLVPGLWDARKAMMVAPAAVWVK
ncbi:hypothetical protein BCR44DRAFT_1440607 [Catenaria anguillulae PL171]|uniref:Uncharacterized protein n=1 Tax=Catenaria anguillulae PL171 TaxID=765915 RepID=A0A1Y2HCQ0_9FUNG|nr:hypothetical protein BCR44DRAFT_1440607 [Catenaria anguillulae PL171]